MADEAGEEVDEKTIDSPEVVTKYRAAADIANKALQSVAAAAKAGAKVVDLCNLGDKTISDAVASTFNKAKTDKGEKIDKGIAFPTCVSVNSCVCHFSPLSDDTTTLEDGDVLSIDLGCHIDGFIALTARSLIVGGAQATGRIGDAMMAAHVAAEAAIQVLRPDKTNYDVTEVLNRAANQFNCEVVEGSLSHQMRRYVIDGNKVIIGKPTHEHRVEEYKIEKYEVYALDIAMSTGGGRTKESDAKATVFKRQVDVEYMLKLKTSRQVFAEISNKFPALPFVLRQLSDERKSKLGINELVNHGLVVACPVLYERDGKHVARVKYTAMVLPNTTTRITSVETPNAVSEIQVTDPVLMSLLDKSVADSNKSKRKKKSGSAKAMQSTLDAQAEASATPAAGGAEATEQNAEATDQGTEAREQSEDPTEQSAEPTEQSAEPMEQS